MAKLAFWSALAAVALLTSAVRAVPVEASSDDGKSSGDPTTTVQTEVGSDAQDSTVNAENDKTADVQKPSAKQEIEEVPDKPNLPNLQVAPRPHQFPIFNPQWFPLPQQQQQDVFYSPFPMFTSPFNRMFQAYNQEFRGILSQFEKELTDFDGVTKTDTDEVEPSLPVNKTTSRTEIIDGHVVQINETTYSSGNDNNKSFFHFKKIHVLPQEPLPQQPEVKKPDPVHPSVATDSISPPKVENPNPDSEIETVDNSNEIPKYKSLQ